MENSHLWIIISNLPDDDKFVHLMFPKSAQEAKLTNKFIKIMFDWREKIDDGLSVDSLGMFLVN